MRLRFAAPAAAAIAAILLPLPCAAPALPMTLDRCTVVAVEMMESVDSTDARPGDFFRFETVNAVTAGADVVIPARTLGYGVVAVASPAGRDARPGTLVLEPLYLVLPNGSHMGVVLNHNTDSLVKNGANGCDPRLSRRDSRAGRRRDRRRLQLLSQGQEHCRPARRHLHRLPEQRPSGRALSRPSRILKEAHMKYVLFYEPADDVLAKAPAHFAAHRARWGEFSSAGSLLMIGPFANPVEGAIAVFTTREAAEAFAAGDPFVLHGVVKNWLIREWNEALV